MSDLAQRIRNARIFRYEYQPGKAVKLRRPTDVEFRAVLEHVQSLEASGGVLKETSEFVSKYVAEWDGLTEADLFDGGADVAVLFEDEALREWVEDHYEVSVKILNALINEYISFKEKLTEAVKK